MANSNGGSTAIVALVAIAVVGALVWFFAMRGAPAQDGGVDVDVNLGDPVEAVTE